MRHFAAILPLLYSLASATDVPAYPGLKAIWKDAFPGPAGSAPSELWNIALE